MRQHLLGVCICGHGRAESDTLNDIPILRCWHCGVVRQHVALNEEELAAWYRDKYLTESYSHTYEHDLAVANKRLDAYQFAPGTRLLDVGCGHGAFVAAARERGIDAWGQDLAKTSESEFVYVGDLKDVAFPTDHFDVVTVHDVLEHLPRPGEALVEIRRILRRPGKLVVDFPAFYSEFGKHHWKKIEHLWMLTEQELVALVRLAGFAVTGWNRPIPSKFVVEGEPNAERRPQILVPPGIGDAYWSLTKLPGFLRARGLGLPDVWVQDSGGPRRTEPFLQNIPFIHAAGYKKLSDRDPIFREAYMQNGRTVFPDVAGTEHFIAYNGVLRFGRSLEEVDPEFGCEWRPKIHVSKAARKLADDLAGLGPYVLTYYAEAGMYRQWLADFSASQIVDALRLIEKALGLRIVFMGAKWDMGQVGNDIAKANPDWTNLIGATTFDQMHGAILGATAVVGFPAGNTMLATVLNKPSVLLWNRYFKREFWKNSCPPDSPYTALDTQGLQPTDVLRALQQLLETDGDLTPTEN